VAQFGVILRQALLFVLVMYIRVHSRNKKLAFLALLEAGAKLNHYL
jgi:hypothetical protein